MEWAKVLVVEDDEDMRQLLDDELRVAGYTVVTASSGPEALEVVRSTGADAVVTDLIMPGMQGTELLGELRRHDPHLPVVIMTAFGTIESAVEAMKGGAFHYLTKPFRMEQLVDTLEQALRECELREALRSSTSGGRAGPLGLIAESPGMRKILDLVSRAAIVDTPVLIQGESGTGKELAARALHAEGPRRERPFIAVNCSAIPETLLESQLFGHRRGTFTDAKEDRRGLFQEAEGGTLFLDEIGDMPMALQGKLLRVLQEREVHPLGAPAPVRVDVRVVAATHRDLEALCAEERFRMDLYYRLNVIPIPIPPLRERPDDLVPLVAHFLDKHGRRVGRSECTVSLEAMERFRSHGWPGNVRELENVIERALVLGHDDIVGVDDLPDVFRARPAGPSGAEGVRMLADVERDQIAKALRAVRGNKAAAARLLGLDRKTLYRKLDLYGIRDL
ncbi:MAG: hypothetical protein A2Z17_05580 [Gammaproteobacteria bacterium RBG_16_66_13]|nr:MAG: hypothetical protein A2Z17_05580 [Gammaproteobacteria bacterium RBG_16_66_13]